MYVCLSLETPWGKCSSSIVALDLQALGILVASPLFAILALSLGPILGVYTFSFVDLALALQSFGWLFLVASRSPNV